MPIKVTLLERSESSEDPLAIYTEITRQFGSNDAYLLENLRPDGTPQVTAQIGYGLLLSVQVYQNQIVITGKRDILMLLAEEAFRCDYDGDDRLILRVENLDPWDALRKVRAIFLVTGDAAPGRYLFGFFGYMGYETVHFVEQLPWNGEADPSCPIIALGVYAHTIQFLAGSTKIRHIISHSDAWNAPVFACNEPRRHADDETNGFNDREPLPRGIRFTTDEQSYSVGVRKALHHIAVGDIYQVQLGHSIAIQSDITPLQVYRRLRQKCASPYMYLASICGRHLIGASPEVFITVRDGSVVMRPLAGTAPRGATADEDEQICERLRSNPKEKAEHIMLVDLCRNDLGRVCKPDSLYVPELLAVERHSHVMHLVSQVRAEHHADVDVFDMIMATFPAGTMTGAPKIRAMEIIAEIEPTRRNTYAGTIGVIDFAGFVDLALCIRTAVFDGKEYVLRASAGIVADSQASLEWQETLHKMGSTYWAVTGEELR